MLQRVFFGVLVAGWVAVATATEPIYLSPEQIDFSRILPPPPLDDSVVAQAELAELHAAVRNADAERIAQAVFDDRNETVVIFNGIMGIDLAALPKVDALFHEIQNDRRAATDHAKAHFKRKRPVVRDPSVKTCGGMRDPLSSFPSGHTAWGYASGIVLAAMAPDKASEILARSHDFGESRIVCGMHFRSDVVAGQVLGTLVAERLLANDRFRTQMAEAVAELRAARASASRVVP